MAVQPPMRLYSWGPDPHGLGTIESVEQVPDEANPHASLLVHRMRDRLRRRRHRRGR